MYLSSNIRPACKTLVVLGGVGILSYWISCRINAFRIRRLYASRRKRKQQEKANSKAEFRKYLDQNPMSETEIGNITSKPFMELVQSLKDGKLTPQHVLLAYQHKAFVVDEKCNCVIDFLYPDFSDVNLDGPFAGAPISLKDNFRIQGYESYVGMSRYLIGPSEHDALLVRVLKSLGAVPFVRTNVPQAMLSVLSYNPVDGMTLNPLDLTKSPGGSSSGEAALIGGGGSGMGLGTDLGGSIRLPAAMCDIVGFKPTPQRLSQHGMFKLERFMNTSSSVGPLGRDVETCIALMKALCDSELHHKNDYFYPPLTYSEQIPANRSLRIGYFTFDGSYKPAPACQRAVLHVKTKLEGRGHQLVAWQPPFKGSEYLTMFLTALLVDGGTPLVELFEHDVVQPTMASGLRLFKSMRAVRLLKRLLVKWFGKPEDLPFMDASCAVWDIPSLTQHIKELKAFQQRVYDHWNDADLDALICPAFGLAAPVSVNSTTRLTGLLAYLHLFNITNMPAGCMPSGIKVSEEDIAALRDTSSESTWHQAGYQTQLESAGFPVSVQVATAPWRDELCLHTMLEVQKAVQS